MRVKPLPFLMAIVFVVLGAEIIMTRTAPPWWLGGMMALGIALDYLTEAMEES